MTAFTITIKDHWLRIDPNNPEKFEIAVELDDFNFIGVEQMLKMYDEKIRAGSGVGEPHSDVQAFDMAKLIICGWPVPNTSGAPAERWRFIHEQAVLFYLSLVDEKFWEHFDRHELVEYNITVLKGHVESPLVEDEEDEFPPISIVPVDETVTVKRSIIVHCHPMIDKVPGKRPEPIHEVLSDGREVVLFLPRPN